MHKFDAIFLQPTYNCALDCEGCYVKGSVGATTDRTNQLGLQTIVNLLSSLPGLYDIGHITIALDNMPGGGAHSLQDHMKGIFVWAIDSAEKWKRKNYSTELHFTCHNLDTIDSYMRNLAQGFISYQCLGEKIKLLSISNIPSLEHKLPYSGGSVKATISTIRNSGTRVNYNYMPRKATLDNFKEVLPHVDIAYIVLFKPGLGRDLNERVVLEYKECLSIMDTWSEELKSKVIVDHCVQDAYKFKKDGLYCGANISKLHIWPNGRVSGCPYDMYNVNSGVTAQTTESILTNIELAYYRRDFDFCTIPSQYPTINKSTRWGSLQIVD